MREVADQVDEAGKRRESELRADLISSRIEPNQGVTLSFLKSLGDCQLSGTLDVLHHHRLLNPLTAPLRFKYFGVFVYHSFLLMVKVRKNSTYESRHWFPLWAARLSNVEDEQNLIPNSFRLSVRDHHFELAASNAKERQLWIDMLSLAISRATFSPPGSQAAFPCSLFFGDAPDGESLEASEAPTPNASRPAEFQGYFETAKAGTVDPLMEFLAMHAAGAAQATGTNNRGQRASSSGPWMPTEILLRHASSNSRAIVDRGMVLSDAVISARIARDGGALSTLYAASGSGIGSAVGSSLGLSRLSAKDTATVKIQRRKSCAGLLENADAEDDPNNLVFTATLVQPGSRSRSSTRGQLDAVSEREGWKSSLLKKANRVRPTSIFAPNGLSVNTDGLASPVWGPGSVSTPSSPITAGRDLLVHEFGSFGITGSVPLSPTTPTSHVAGIGGAELASHSLTSSPNSGSNSAANSTVNLRAQGYAMPTRSRTSLYSMKDSLTMTFGKRVRTRSVQGGRGRGRSDARVWCGIGAVVSGGVAHGEQRESAAWRGGGQQFEKAVGRRAVSRPEGALAHQLDLVGHRVDSESVYQCIPGHAQPQAGTERGSQGRWVRAEREAVAETVVEEEAAKTGGTLRRSRTMLDYSRSWFRGSATSVVERVNAQAVAPATSPTASPSPMASPGQEQGPRGVGSKGDGMRRSSDTHVGTVNAQPSRARQSSKVYNKLKFLHNNKLSPMQ
ncbi:hypothetical protein L1887_57728 [Cichorium endivia]|nr:hypothetical protein L1887_57728 [Cichorium endivia]